MVNKDINEIVIVEFAFAKNLVKLLSGGKDNKSLEMEIMEEFIKNVELLLEQIFLRLVKKHFCKQTGFKKI